MICLQHGTIVPFPTVMPKSTVLGTNPQSQVSYHGTQEPGVCPAFCRYLAILAVSAQRTCRGISAAVHGIWVFRCREILGVRQCVATCSTEFTSNRTTELDIRARQSTPSGLTETRYSFVVRAASCGNNNAGLVGPARCYRLSGFRLGSEVPGRSSWHPVSPLTGVRPFTSPRLNSQAPAAGLA